MPGIRALVVMAAAYTIGMAMLLVRGRRRTAAARRDAADVRARFDEAQALLERTRAAAEEANRAKSLFLANMSHELRTPLHAIIDYAAMAVEVLEPEQDASELTADLNRIGAAARHLLAIIDTVLDLSRAEAGQARLVVESFDVAAAMREVAEAAATLATANDNSFELRCGNDLGVMRSDPAKLRQVLLNLLSNAGKYTDRGRVVLTAERSADSRELTFAVRDTGRGLSSEQRRKLFRPFGVVDEASSDGGMGLGLALSRRFCALMGGDISVESTPGGGSTFTVRLPASVPEFAASGVFIAPAAPAVVALEHELVS